MPAKQKQKQKGGKRAQEKQTDKHADEKADEDYGDDSQDIKTLIKPPNQAELTDQQLKMEITNILKCENPQASTDAVLFNFKQLQYTKITNISHTVILFKMSGSVVHKSLAGESVAEGGKQATQSETKKTEQKTENKDDTITSSEGDLDETKDEDVAQQEFDQQKDDLGDLGDEEEPLEQVDQKRRNKFNYNERAVQTFNNPSRDHDLTTEVPSRQTYSCKVTQWDIYDIYEEDLKKQAEKKDHGKREEEKVRRRQQQQEVQGDELSKVESVIKVMERMVNQNTFDEISLDFKFWEDPSDEFREQGAGSLLPLWKFSYKPVKLMAVTSLSWNSYYTDMFAVGYGSYDFFQQSQGKVCLYSLKCPSHPDRIFNTDAAVYNLEFHWQQAHLLAVGMCDGSVMVFNLKGKKNQAAFSSIDSDSKHFDSVWNVKWVQDNLDGHHNFCSVSADGRVINWALVKNEFVPTEMIRLRKEDRAAEGPEGTQLESISCGTALSFNRSNPKLFLVGTEEGLIHKCSTIYTSQYLATYKNHTLAVYCVEWNHYHPRVFVSCSADWKVCVWDHTLSEPVFVFDLSQEVGDVKWAPYSSTVFAAVTADNKVHIFDLNMNQHEPICLHSLIQKKGFKPTRVALNHQHAVIIIGDDRGRISSYKMSPNLRSSLKNNVAIDNEAFRNTEIEKMEKLLVLAKDPANKEKNLSVQ